MNSSKQSKINEAAQITVERINDESEAKAKKQPAKPLPDRNKWTRQQLERSDAEFKKMVKQEKARGE